MKPELEEKIFQDFPLIFPNGRFVSEMDSCMYWGLDCGDGWFDLIYNFCQHMQTRIENVSYFEDGKSWKPCQFTADQVKEKFGTLRFYHSGFSLKAVGHEDVRPDPEADGILSHVEFLSSITCENCGQRGKIVGKSWVKCRCEDCILNETNI